MTYESGKVKIKAPIGAAANAGPFTIRVQADAPNHMAGSVTPPTFGGALSVKGITDKFTADITLSAEVRGTAWVPQYKTEGPCLTLNAEIFGDLLYN